MGEAVLGKKIGNKALLWGAIAGTIPDLDVVPGAFMDIVSKNAFHRGISHSIVLFVVLAPLLGYLTHRLYKKTTTFWQWTHLFFWGFLTHSLLDCFTTWGTQLFWPFETRVAFKSIFVIDPLYTLPFLVLLLFLLPLPKTSIRRRRLNLIALCLSSSYLLFTLINKQAINTVFEQAFEANKYQVLRYETKPAPLNNLLWSGTAETTTGYYIGYYSWLDQSPVDFQFYPKNEELLNGYEQEPLIHSLKKITEGYYTLSEKNDTLVFNDLRFGTLQAWEKGDTFVFAYKLSRDEKGVLHAEEVKKKFDQGSKLVQAIWNRMLGNK